MRNESDKGRPKAIVTMNQWPFSHTYLIALIEHKGQFQPEPRFTIQISMVTDGMREEVLGASKLDELDGILTNPLKELEYRF